MPGCHLRPHNEQNSNQHAETMRQVPAPELDSYLSWFRTLPIWLDLDGLRVVHACWDENMTGQVSGPITDEFLHSACRKGQPLYAPVEILQKGKEARLPEGLFFKDKEGHQRFKTRLRGCWCSKGQPASSSRTECWNWESGFCKYLGLPKAPRDVDDTR